MTRQDLAFDLERIIYILKSEGILLLKFFLKTTLATFSHIQEDFFIHKYMQFTAIFIHVPDNGIVFSIILQRQNMFKKILSKIVFYSDLCSATAGERSP